MAVGAGGSAVVATLTQNGIEVGLVVVAVVSIVVLSAIRLKHAHDQKMRKAAGSGYYDFDVARYGTGTPGRSIIDAPADSGPMSLSPSFNAPKRGSKRKGRTPIDPLPIPPAFAAVQQFGSPPPFDPLEAQRTRPAESSRDPLPLMMPPPGPAAESAIPPPPPRAAAPIPPPPGAASIPPPPGAASIPPPPGAPPAPVVTSSSTETEGALSALPLLLPPPPPAASVPPPPPG